MTNMSRRHKPALMTERKETGLSRNLVVLQKRIKEGLQHGPQTIPCAAKEDVVSTMGTQQKHTSPSVPGESSEVTTTVVAPSPIKTVQHSSTTKLTGGKEERRRQDKAPLQQ